MAEMVVVHGCFDNPFVLPSINKGAINIVGSWLLTFAS